ncbi:MAG: hypothetical protein NTZ56_14960 [Acidobacteria bacterium]|nr:hypothetical protein [Acidobacteriota bacterium]
MSHALQTLKVWNLLLLITFQSTAIDAMTFAFKRLDVPGALNYTAATSINNRGQVVAYFSSPDGYRSSLYDRGQFQTLQISLDSYGALQQANGINDKGQIVGSYSYFGNYLRGFLYESGSSRAVDASSGITTLYDINNSGVVVGWTVVGSLTHGLIVRDSIANNFDYPGAETTLLRGLNDDGELVGSYFGTGTSPIWGQGFLLRGKDSFTTISYPLKDPKSYFSGSIPFDVNNRGDVVGVFFDGDSLGHGFLRKDGHYFPVNYPGAITTSVLGINDQGQLVGGYFDETGVHGFIAVQVPEPASISLIVLVIVAGAFTFVLQNKRRSLWFYFLPAICHSVKGDRMPRIRTFKQ